MLNNSTNRTKTRRIFLIALLIMINTAVKAAATTQGALPPIIALLLDDDLIEQVQAIATGRVNDTGVTIAALNATEHSDQCDGINEFAQQDCNFGRDANNNDDTDGTAGFNFTKVDENGVSLPLTATQWSCVLDNVTGLLWEVKTNDDGLHDGGNTYSWFDTNTASNGGSPGSENNGACVRSDCDTQSFVSAVNTQGLCGFNDWRMPTFLELADIADMGQFLPAIDTRFFPNIQEQNRTFWSGSAIVQNSSNARALSFGNTSSLIRSRASGFAVRLVRSEP